MLNVDDDVECRRFFDGFTRLVVTAFDRLSLLVCVVLEENTAR